MSKPHKLSAKALAICKAASDGIPREHLPKLTGASERTCRRVLADPRARAHLDTLARQHIEVAKGMAARKVVSLMDSESSKISLDAAKLVLELGNIRPPQGPPPQFNVSVNLQAGYVLDQNSSPEKIAEAKRAVLEAPHGGFVIDLTGTGPVIEHEPSEAQGG